MGDNGKKVKAIIKNNESDTNGASNPPKYHFKNLVFEGGGVKGIAYVGALNKLNEEGILPNIQRVAGTSAGAMVATLVGLDFSTNEISDILWDINFQNFLDSSWGVVRNTSRLLTEYGWYKGDFFRSLMADLIQRKTGNGEITFEELEMMRKEGKPFRELHLIGADVNTGYAIVFNSEKTPEVKIADAARISMSIPLFFAVVRRNEHIYVDGGLLDNYPIKVFDQTRLIEEENNKRKTDYYERINNLLGTEERSVNATEYEYVYNKETLGFRLDAKEDINLFLNHREPPIKEIKSFFTYTKALVTTLIDAQCNVHLHSDDWQRTIYIDTLGVNSLDFGLSNSMKQALVKSGYDFTTAYLDWYNNDEEKANK